MAADARARAVLQKDGGVIKTLLAEGAGWECPEKDDKVFGARPRRCLCAHSAPVATVLMPYHAGSSAAACGRACVQNQLCGYPPARSIMLACDAHPMAWRGAWPAVGTSVLSCVLAVPWHLYACCEMHSHRA